MYTWWWVHSCPKHVQKSNKHIKKICTPSWFYLQDFTGMHGQQNIKKLSNKYIGRHVTLVFLYLTVHFFFCRCGPTRAIASSFMRFLDYTKRRITNGRNLPDEWSARRRDLYLKTHNIHKRQTSMPPAEFEPRISAGERPQTYTLDHAATGIGWRYRDHIFTVYCAMNSTVTIYSSWKSLKRSKRVSSQKTIIRKTT